MSSSQVLNTRNRLPNNRLQSIHNHTFSEATHENRKRKRITDDDRRAHSTIAHPVSSEHKPTKRHRTAEKAPVPQKQKPGVALRLVIPSEPAATVARAVERQTTQRAKNDVTKRAKKQATLQKPTFTQTDVRLANSLEFFRHIPLSAGRTPEPSPFPAPKDTSQRLQTLLGSFPAREYSKFPGPQIRKETASADNNWHILQSKVAKHSAWITFGQNVDRQVLSAMDFERWRDVQRKEEEQGMTEGRQGIEYSADDAVQAVPRTPEKYRGKYQQVKADMPQRPESKPSQVQKTKRTFAPKTTKRPMPKRKASPVKGGKVEKKKCSPKRVGFSINVNNARSTLMRKKKTDLLLEAQRRGITGYTERSLVRDIVDAIRANAGIVEQ